MTAAEIINELRARGVKLACAESCTGGLLADAFISISGASEVFLGGVVAYDEAIKRSVLGVESKDIASGVVSEKCAVAMARKARELFKADIALSTTGYAEKSDRPDIQDGTVFIGFASPEKSFAKVFRFVSDRNSNRKSAVKKALEILSEHLAP